MGRFRVNCNNKVVSSGEYNDRLVGLNTIKHARTKNENKPDENFIINYNTWEIVRFKTYSLYLATAKAFFIINPECNLCPDVPIDLKQALHSEICYDELLEHVYNCKSHPCKKCDTILKLDFCKEKSNLLYPYGHFNNDCLGKNFKFPVKIDIQCCKSELICPKYNFCKCPAFWDKKNCKYQVIFPSECKFLYYDKEAKPFIDEPPNEKGCCLPVVKKHRCFHCYHEFAPSCSKGYNCPSCNHRYENEGHYLTDNNHFNCYNCNNKMKIDPYFESSCNKCNKVYKPHGAYCSHLKELSSSCEFVKNKHEFAYSVYPKTKNYKKDKY